MVKCHPSELNELVKSTENMSIDELKHTSLQYDGLYFHPKINRAARFSLGSSIKLMEEIVTGRVDNGFAILRPPGHHACDDEPNGLCIFNNAAITAKIALERFNLKRILIVDWDGIIKDIYFHQVKI